MKCHECVEFLADYLDGALPADQMGVFQQHMDRCPQCVEYIRTYEESIRLGQAICGCGEDEDALPKDIPEKLVEAILATLKRNE